MISVIIAFAFGAIIGAGSRHVSYRRNLGEAKVADAIETQLTRPHVLLTNVTLTVGNETTQIDHILVADTGIFVIETKHYKGWILGHPRDNQWTQVIYRVKSRFKNPIHQNYGHMKAVMALFTLPDEVFHSVVAFVGEAEFKTDLGPEVVHLHELIPLLSADRPVMFDERKMAYVVGRIEMKRLRRSIDTDEYHLDSIRRRMHGKRDGRL